MQFVDNILVSAPSASARFATPGVDIGLFCTTPMVALTSHATPEDIDHGYESGFDEYIAKFDRDTLLSTISKTLARGNEA